MTASSPTVAAPLVGPTRARVSVAVALLLLFYAFLRDNSASLPYAAGYEWTRLVSLPRQVRFLEFAVIGGLCIVVLSRPISRLSGRLLAGTAVFAALSIVSQAVYPLVGAVDWFRLVYMYVLPILVFVIASELSWHEASLQRVAAFVFAWVAISAAVSWAQYLYFGYEPGDDITGLNQNAHVNAALMIVGMFLCLARGLVARRRVWLAIALALGGSAVLPSALKTLALTPFLVGVLLRDSWRRGGRGDRREPRFNARGVTAVGVVAVLLWIGAESFSHIDFRSSARLPDIVDRAVNAPLTLAPFVAHGLALDVMRKHPSAAFIGLGPYSFSNPISMGHSGERDDLGRLTLSVLLPESTETGEDARVTLTSSLMVEFGLVAFAVLAYLYLSILLRLRRCARAGIPLVRMYGAALTPALLLLMATAILAQFDSITSLALSWSIMMLAGAVVQVDRHSERRLTA